MKRLKREKSSEMVPTGRRDQAKGWGTAKRPRGGEALSLAEHGLDQAGI